MAVRATDRSIQANVPQNQAIAQDQQAPAAEQLFQELLVQLDQAIEPGRGRAQWLSGAEAKELIAQAQAAGPEVEKMLAKHLGQGLRTGKIGEKPLKLGDAALKKLAAFTGVPAGTYRSAVQAEDGAAEHQLAEGLNKQKVEISQDQKVATKNTLDDLALQSATGGAVSKEEFTPHYEAAKAIKGVLDKHLEAKHPDAKVAMDAMSPIVQALAMKTAVQVAADPQARVRVAEVMAKVGQEGFIKAVKRASPEVATAFSKATGLRIATPAAGKMLKKLPKLAHKISPQAGAKMAGCCTRLGAKLGLEGAGKAAKAGAKSAATTGKAVPGLGNALAVGGTLLSGAGFVKALFDDPRNPKIILKKGLNTLTQAVGIAFPWVGLAGDVVDLGWSAKMAAAESRQGMKLNPELANEDAAPLIAEPSRILASALEGAGQSDAASSLEALADATEDLAENGFLEARQMDALSSLSNVAATETKKAAKETRDPAEKEALRNLSRNFGELFQVLYQHKRMKGQDGPKRDDLAAALMKITGDVAVNSAALSDTVKDIKDKVAAVKDKKE